VVAENRTTTASGSARPADPSKTPSAAGSPGTVAAGTAASGTVRTAAGGTAGTAAGACAAAPTPEIGVDDHRLYDAVKEMELLLAHATEAGRVIDEQRIKVLVNAKRAVKAGTIKPAQEIAFWHEFQELGQELLPITVASLKATSPEIGPDAKSQKSHANRAVRRYQIWSVVALVSLLVIQIYTIFGSKTVADIQELSRKIDAETLKIDDLTRRLAEVTGEESANLVVEIRNADTRLNQMNDVLFASYDLLVVWFPVKYESRDPTSGQIAQYLQAGQIILESLSTYVLPLLYGLLGACVYVLRTLSIEIKNLIYTIESDIRFQLRIYLGALAGLAIGWFSPSGSTAGFIDGADGGTGGTLLSIGPVALAFLAGYSVELLFSAMDTIITAFSKKDGSKGAGK